MLHMYLKLLDSKFFEMSVSISVFITLIIVLFTREYKAVKDFGYKLFWEQPDPLLNACIFIFMVYKCRVILCKALRLQ